MTWIQMLVGIIFLASIIAVLVAVGSKFGRFAKTISVSVSVIIVILCATTWYFGIEKVEAQTNILSTKLGIKDKEFVELTAEEKELQSMQATNTAAAQVNLVNRQSLITMAGQISNHEIAGELMNRSLKAEENNSDIGTWYVSSIPNMKIYIQTPTYDWAEVANIRIDYRRPFRGNAIIESVGGMKKLMPVEQLLDYGNFPSGNFPPKFVPYMDLVDGYIWWDTTVIRKATREEIAAAYEAPVGSAADVLLPGRNQGKDYRGVRNIQQTVVVFHTGNDEKLLKQLQWRVTTDASFKTGGRIKNYGDRPCLWLGVPQEYVDNPANYQLPAGGSIMTFRSKLPMGLEIKFLDSDKKVPG